MPEYRSLTVILDHDVDEDALSQISAAIKMIKTVQSVEAGKIVDLDSIRAAEEFKREFYGVLTTILYASSPIAGETAKEFIRTVRSAYETYKHKRTY